MRKVILYLIAFIILGTYVNRLDTSLIEYPAKALVVVPEGQTTSSVLGALQAAREASSGTAARTRAQFENPKSDPAIAAYQHYLKILIPRGEWSCYFNIIEKESKWNPLAQNPTSTAFGIGQFIDNTWEVVGFEKTKDPYYQIDAMIKYVELIYGDGCNAWEFKNKRGWY